MDFFTHLMIGFLISAWASGTPYNQYVILGTFMAMIQYFETFLLSPIEKASNPRM